MQPGFLNTSWQSGEQSMSNSGAVSRILIRGGRVYDHEGDVHQPAQADILISG